MSLLHAALLLAQLTGAAESDPVRLGWMFGSPPPPARRIRFEDGSCFRFPQTRWTYSNFQQLVPTKRVARSGPAIPLPRAERADLDAVSFLPLGSTQPMTWLASLEANYTDGILVLHQGQIVYERYFGVLTPTRQHIAYSVTKSILATLAATLIHEKRLDPTAPVSHYIREMAPSALGNATIEQLLEMTTGPKYSEDYTDPDAEVWAHARATGSRPRPAGYQGPTTTADYLVGLTPERAHGDRFSYKTVNADVLAWVLTRVTGQSLATLVEQRLWSRLGVEHDAYFLIDSAGTEFAGGGLNLTLPDLARFGEMMRNDGRVQGRQIIPAAVMADIRRGGSQEKFAQAGYPTLPGWSYHHMWWVSHNDHGAYAARGVHGQGIYIDPKAEMVIVRFASHPQAGNGYLDPTTLPAYQALAEHLLRTRTRPPR